jgi:UDP-N-acetyl-2-amino-2-deoxyglucuronate dehydrogenase
MQIGLIGSGNISGTHARAASAIPGVKIVAVYGPHAERVQKLAGEYSACGYTDLDRFLDHRPMDAVAIGTPSGLHAAHGVAAARRGLHVLVEKPIDITTARADTLIDAAREHDVKLGVFFQDRFAPGVRALKALVDEKRLGRPLLASARVKWYRPREYYANSTWRGTRSLDGGGALMNQGVHTVDLLWWLLGSVRRVVAITTAAWHAIEVEDTALALLEFENGVVATLEATTAAFPGYPRRVELTGTEGTAILEDDRLVSADLRSENATGRSESPAMAVASPRSSSPIVADVSGHRAVIEDFIAAVKHDRPPCCDGREARHSVALVEAIYESARRRVAVEVGVPAA